MTKEYRRYRCDFGHEWILFKERDGAKQPAEGFCREGHPAVTMRREPVIEDVIITFRPAGRIADRVRGQEIMRGRYFLVISDWNGRQLVSEKTFAWDQVCELARKFEKRSFDWAEQNWSYLVPSSSG